MAAIKAEFAAAPPKIATRVASQKVLEKLVPALPSLIGGSADLTGSNGTRTAQHVPVAPSDYAGNYIHYGVREHAMAAAMNGLALHGGLIPYGATFLVFTDYCRPAIRLSALMHQRVVYVMTHDSIGLGEDGPTHQPVEHLAALRAIPNLNVYRPADPIETAECWELALASSGTPSILALTRQAVPALRKGDAENLCAKGAYVLAEAAGGKRDATILATGSEVGLAMEARELLAKDGKQAAVVSMPCWELFAAQPVAYRDAVLGKAPRVAVEAAVELRLGAVARRARRVHRHGRLRRLGSRARTLQTLRHHSGQGGGGGKEGRRLSLMDLEKLKTTAGLDLKGKRVIVRADLNVPVKDGKVTDATRLERLVAGLEDLAKRGARVVVISHFGRPKGGPDPQFSLKPVADKLGTTARPARRFCGRLHRRAGGARGRGAAAGADRRAGEPALPQGRGEERSRVRQAAGRARRPLRQ